MSLNFQLNIAWQLLAHEQRTEKKRMKNENSNELELIKFVNIEMFYILKSETHNVIYDN